MYHDQGHIPFKMLAFDSGVNSTLGLPVIRTSPDHGTAFDIAWRGKANPGSMSAAVELAVFAPGRGTAGGRDDEVKFRWCIPILFLLAAPLFAEEGMVLKPKQEPPQVNAILASVNGVPISLMDILNTTRNSEYQAYAVFSGKRLEEEIRKIRLKAVNDRIDKLLVLEEFRENPFPIPNQAVEEELDNIAERMGVRSRSEFTQETAASGTDDRRSAQGG